jgi:cold shock CspA family protein
MARSKESFNKKEKEKKKLKQKQEKREKMEERKANSSKKSLDDMMAYIDEDGNLTTTPPDPQKKRVFNLEDIEIGVPKQQEEDPNAVNEGTITYFNESRGFGFITSRRYMDRLFFHINSAMEQVKENDIVTFDVEKGPRGLTAVNVRKYTAPAS